ncbi:MAG: Flp family type IVb pilin [Phycisphaerae bacterium]
MASLIHLAKRLAVETDGHSTTEYAVVLALIAAATFTAITALGAQASQFFLAVDGTLEVPDGY